MSRDERENLLSEIEEIRSSIERLEPQVHEQEVYGAESSRNRLKALRKELARDMEQLHES